MVEQHQLAALEHQVGLPVLGDVGDDLQHRFLDLLQRLGIRTLERLTLALHVAVELVDLRLKLTSLLVQRVGRKRGLLPLQRVALLAQGFFLLRDLLGVFVAFPFDLLAHHFRRLRILQQRLDVDHHDRQVGRPRRGRGRRGRLLRPSVTGTAGQPRKKQGNHNQRGKPRAS